MSDMSSCESNEFSNMDEKINMGLKQGNIPKNLVLRNSIFKQNIMKPDSGKTMPKRDSLRMTKNANIKSAEKMESTKQ
jgi:hypothetical protein